MGLNWSWSKSQCRIQHDPSLIWPAAPIQYDAHPTPELWTALFWVYSSSVTSLTLRRNQSSDSRKHKYPFFPYVFFQSFPKVGELCAYTTCILNLWEYYVKKPNENTQQPSGHVLLLFPSRSRVSFFPSLSLFLAREKTS